MTVYFVRGEITGLTKIGVANDGVSGRSAWRRFLAWRRGR